MSKVTPSVSLVVPVWNERETLQALFDRSRKALESLACGWELLFVDDGSTDGSAEFLRAVVRQDGRVRVVLLSGNFGQHAALSAGLELARGETVVIMDGDLQLDPEDVPRLVRKVAEGFDLVGGWRLVRRDSALTRKLPSALFNRALTRFTGVRLRDFNCGFKAMTRELVSRINRQGDRRRYLAPLLPVLSERMTEIPVGHHPRVSGTSKYTLRRSLGLILRSVALLAEGLPPSRIQKQSPLLRFLSGAAGIPLRAFSSHSKRPLFIIREVLERPEPGSRREM